MQQTIQNKFQEIYQTEPLLCAASGRVNIIGEHTDYNQGLALPMCINRHMYFALAENHSDVVNLFAYNRSEHASFNVQTPITSSEQWSAYFGAIISRLIQLHFPIKGIDVVFGGTIPMGAGLSSSAALSCGFITGLNELFQLQLSQKQIAVLAQEAEHILGLQCGLLDQYAIVFGKENHAMFIDFESHEVQPVHMEMDAEWLLIDSKIEHNLVEDHSYNDRRSSCERVVQIISNDHDAVTSLRQVSRVLLEEYEPTLNPTEYKRALFIIEENERVRLACAAMKRKDPVQLGHLMFASHAGQSKDYDISTPEIDQLVHLLRKRNDIFGARMTGGGFGGCIICLVKKGQIPEIKRMITNLSSKTVKNPVVYEIKGSDGIAIIDAAL